MNSEEISDKDVKVAKNIKILIIVGCTALSLMGISVIFRGLTRPPEKAGQPIEVETEAKAEPVPETTKPVVDGEVSLAEQRQVKQLKLEASYNNLKESFDNLDSEVRLGRAQRWLIQAKEACDRMGYNSCSSPQEYLRVQLQKKLTELDSVVTRKNIKLIDGMEVIEATNQMGISATEVNKYRKLKEEILDISLALSNRPGVESSVVNVPTNDLKNTAVEYVKAASNLSSTDTKTVTVTGKSEVATNDQE